MTKLIGMVQKIEVENNNGNEKVVITLSPKNKRGFGGMLFIEFQGSNIDKTNGVKVFDNIIVDVVFKGKISYNGNRFNNIIGKSIKSINQ